MSSSKSLREAKQILTQLLKSNIRILEHQKITINLRPQKLVKIFDQICKYRQKREKALQGIVEMYWGY